MKRFRRPKALAAIAVLAAAPAASYAQALNACPDTVVLNCTQAINNQNLFTKWGIGITCAASLGACVLNTN